MVISLGIVLHSQSIVYYVRQLTEYKWEPGPVDNADSTHDDRLGFIPYVGRGKIVIGSHYQVG